jgi:hypothetical protein
VKSIAAFPGPKVSPAIGVDALSGRWRGETGGSCGMIAEMTIETKHFNGWVGFVSGTVVKFSGTMEDDGTIVIKSNDGRGYVNIVGQLPHLRINKVLNAGGSAPGCDTSSILFHKIGP